MTVLKVVLDTTYFAAPRLVNTVAGKDPESRGKEGHKEFQTHA